MNTMRQSVTAFAAALLLSLLRSGGLAHAEATPVLLSEERHASVSAIDSLRRAAETGDADAMNALGVLYCGETEFGHDYTSALYWYLKAAGHGSTRAMNNIARMYLDGLRVSPDGTSALAWFKRSAAQGDVRGEYSLAVMADNGIGAAPDSRLALAMYQRAAEAGFGPAMLHLSEAYARGRGTRRDLVLADAWLDVALQAGLPEELQAVALSALESLDERLTPDRLDRARLIAAHLTAVLQARGVASDAIVESAVLKRSP